MASRGIVAMGMIGMVIGACQGPIDLTFEIGEATQSVVVATGRDNALAVEAIDVSSAPFFTIGSEGDGIAQMTFLEYETSLALLDIEPGSLRRIRDDEPSQALPDPNRIHVRTVDRNNLGEWVEVPDVPGDVALFRFKRTTTRQCLEGGGCLVDQRCATPCPPPSVPEPPMPPSPPMMTCRPGWVLVPPTSDGDAAICEPYDSSGVPIRCPRGMQHLPGTAGCTDVSDACPGGEFADDAPPDAVFVRPGATNGTGTIAQPVGTIAEALLVAPSNGTIALARGTYVERFELSRTVTLIGACAGETIIDGGQFTGVTVTASTSIQNLTITGVRPLIVFASGRTSLRGVVLDGDVSVSLTVQGGAVSGSRVDIRSNGTGISADGGAQVELTDVTMLDIGSTAVSIQSGAHIELVNCAIDGTGGTGVYASGGTAALTGCVVGDFEFGGVQVVGDNAEMTLDDVVVRDARGDRATGLYSWSKAVLTGHRVVVERARGSGVSCSDANVELTDSVIRDTRSQRLSGEYGNGVEVSQGGHAHLERVVIWSSRGVGVLSYEEGSVAELTDVTVADTLGWESTGERGIGLNANNGDMILNRVYLPRSHGFGIVATLSGNVGGTDLRVTGTVPRDSDGGFGRGAEVSNGANLTVTRSVFEDNRGVAVAVLDPNSLVDLTDVVLSGTTETGCVGLSCNAGLADGLSVFLSSTARVNRFEIIDNAQYGLRIANNPMLSMSDGRIANNSVGIQTVSPAFDLADVADRVLLEGNLESVSVFE